MTPAVIDRIAKLLRMICDRSNDGETLVAASRLSAIVTSHDVDWDQALAGNGNGSAVSQEDMQRIFNAGYERGMQDAATSKPSAGDWAPAGKSRANEVGEKIGELEAIIDAAERAKADGCLSDFHVEFTGSMRDRLNNWGARTFVSEKQWEVLNRLRSILERTDYL
jgi:ribulose bisphosphate carboxylase small subunit